MGRERALETTLHPSLITALQTGYWVMQAGAVRCADCNYFALFSTKFHNSDRNHSHKVENYETLLGRQKVQKVLILQCSYASHTKLPNMRNSVAQIMLTVCSCQWHRFQISDCGEWSHTPKLLSRPLDQLLILSREVLLVDVVARLIAM